MMLRVADEYDRLAEWAEKIEYLGGTKNVTRAARDEARRIAVNIAELPEVLIRTSCPQATPGIFYKPVSRVRHRMIDILR
jgi:hypothetical protein